MAQKPRQTVGPFTLVAEAVAPVQAATTETVVPSTESTPAPAAPERNPLLVEIGFDFDAAAEEDAGQGEGDKESRDTGGGEPETVTKAEAEALVEAARAEGRKAGASAATTELTTAQQEEKADNDRRTREAGQKQAAASLRQMVLATYGKFDDTGAYIFHSDELRSNYAHIEGALANVEQAVKIGAREGTTAALMSVLAKDEQPDFQKDIDKAIRDGESDPSSRPMNSIVASWKKRIVTSETKGMYTKTQLKEAVDAALTADKERRAKAGGTNGSQAPARVNNGSRASGPKDQGQAIAMLTGINPDGTPWQGERITTAEYRAAGYT